MGEPLEPDCVRITEGAATILFPTENQVFYNPVQEFNRDLSIAVIKQYSSLYWQPSSFKKKKGPKCGSTRQQSPPDPTGVQLDAQTLQPVPEKPREGSKEEGSTSPVASSSTAVVETEDTNPTGVVVEGTNKWRGVRTGLHILEALAASGLRSIRYALEVPGIERIVANDYSRAAYQNILRNVQRNNVGDHVIPCCREASALMYDHRGSPDKRFDVIDIDPYGTPAAFLDATLQSVADGGLLCVTCTDMSVLCGNHGESCHSKYGSMSLKARYCHEMSLRIVLSCLESHANRYHRYIVPLLSCSIDFYVRVFVRVFTSPAVVKRTPSKLSLVYHCNGCGSFHLQPLGKKLEDGKKRKYPPSTGPPVDRKCDQCGHVFKLGGPIWSDPIHDQEFVQSLLGAITRDAAKYRTFERMEGLLSVVSEELHDVPLYYVVDQLCNILHCNSPKIVVLRSALMALGYRASISHACANSLKTDAPHHVIWDVMRCWVKHYPTKPPKKDSPAASILSIEPKVDACFTILPEANPKSRQLKLARFPENPEANWGPKARARRSESDKEDLPSKRRRLQGKRVDS